jgi:DNA-directed RNA polymerase specialized sigma24 family protein
MNELEFKKINRPSSCTTPPWAAVIDPKDRPEVLRKIRDECVDIYGYSFDECPKRLTCWGKSCAGRPLPTESPTARPYLEKLEKTHSVVSDELFITTNCQTCPIFKKCKSPCNQVLDFIDRSKKSEPALSYRDSIANLEPEMAILEPANLLVNGEDIPWDCISSKKAEIIRKYLYEQFNYRHIADLLNLNNQARVKYEFYSAVTKLSEYAAVRKFLATNESKLTERQREIFNLVYRRNLTFVKTAELLGISKQSTQQAVSRVIKRYNVKWKVYVKKRGNKVIYSVPEVFK